ncbi:hypothetical protein ONZ45_g7019 [Pleurotus djamor]|nr:hypothetical protein ONZ45_g7019 [Pleurotus djamor]
MHCLHYISALLLGSLFVGTALAQSALIGYPLPGDTISAGSNITIEVDRPNSLTGSTEVGISLSLQSCPPERGCIASTDLLGPTLYAGSFHPDFSVSAPGKPPHQNFTVTIPSSFVKGTALLSLCHFSLVGAGPFPLFETRNVTLNVV